MSDYNANVPVFDKSSDTFSHSQDPTLQVKKDFEGKKVVYDEPIVMDIGDHGKNLQIPKQEQLAEMKEQKKEVWDATWHAENPQKDKDDVKLLETKGPAIRDKGEEPPLKMSQQEKLADLKEQSDKAWDTTWKA